MNWDWEKLQEKRQRQPGGTPGSGPTPPPGLQNLGDKFKNFKGFSFPAWKFVLLGGVLLWAATGIFIVSPDEEGVVLRFGKYNRTVDPGPHYHLPYPMESVLKPKVTQVQRIEVGFRGAAQNTSFTQGQVRPVIEEASMLTSDENIVSVQFSVQYRIIDSRKYLFNIARQGESVKNAAEAAMRETIGRSEIDSALTDGKLEIQNAVRDLLQNILDSYEAGITILAVQMQDVYAPDEVMAAFKDVASAREDMRTTINEAEAYRNRILPEARGRAAEVINRAEAYRASTVRRAEGESHRFLALLKEYAVAKDVTRRRMYLETMEEILSQPGMEKVILSKDAGSRTLPLLPMGGKQ